MSDGIKRRDFLKVLGATGAGVATAGCSTREVEKLVPYVVAPEDVVPGVPTFYTSTCRECPAGCGIHVETHEGRVTKVEGNPDHPVSRGNTCARGQASVQGLYHPDRHRGPFRVEADVGGAPLNLTWSAAEQQVAAQIRSAPAGSVYMLSGTYGPSMEALVSSFAAATGITRVTYDPFADTPRDLDFADSRVLVSFGADFLETWGSPVDYAWQFAQMHAYREGGERGFFAWVGPHRPLTGINADLWINCRPGTEIFVAQALSGGVSPDEAARQTGVERTKIERLLQYWNGAGAGGRTALGPGAAVHGSNGAALASAIAGLNGRPWRPADMRPLVDLIRRMEAGQVRVLLIDAPNPAYSLPGGLNFARALQRVPVRVSFSSFPDETAKLCNFVLPQSHFLESWDDYQSRPGVLSLVQPAMRPVFNTKAVGDVFLGMASHLNVAVPGLPAGGRTFYDYLVAARGGAGEAWREALKRGGYFGGGAGAGLAAGAAAATTPAPAAAQPTTPAAPAQPTAPAAGAATAAAFQGPEGGLALVVYPSYRFYDGRTANRPWLLELPDPVTKVPWDAWVELHPRTAERLNVEQGDVVEVSAGEGRRVELPAYVWPGVREDAAAIQMGLGHDGNGRWTEGRGANPMRLLGGAVDPTTGAFAHYGQRVQVRRLRDRGSRWEGMFEWGVRVQHDRRIAQAVSLATIQQLDGRGEGHIPGTEQHLEALRGNGGFTPEGSTTDPAAGYPPAGTEYGEYIEGMPRWAMTIDLSRCIGCSACTVACNAENNIPVVGPTEMKRGRELFWLRVERYFGVTREPQEAMRDDATDDVRFLPMLCQHCGNAPCEPVCPVYAAYHTPDGLNGQVYNRCVGTRYCANNCPWKVRVFNWFTYEFVSPLNWQLNPDVTVREKGVMEKCTFCVQRIHEKERAAAVEGRTVRDGEVVPACAQACPTEVFTFGDITDRNSAVARAATSNRGYRTLGELNTQPAIVYLKKVTLHEPANGWHEERPAPFGGDEHTPQGGEPAPAQQGGH
jgi:Fe-S-cluster-containing dehydrogenase component/anaerobic selenocysteine-containing dehydrogenase